MGQNFLNRDVQESFETWKYQNQKMREFSNTRKCQNILKFQMSQIFCELESVRMNQNRIVSVFFKIRSWNQIASRLESVRIIQYLKVL